MIIKKLYYKGYKKAFNVTYDDGVTQDERFVKLLNKYGILGTFNINSGLTMNQFTWKHDSGLLITRLTKDQMISLYQEHEVASHSLFHPMLTDMNYDAILRELSEDKRILEEWFQCDIKGFAYPFGPYNELTTQCVKENGFKYARIGDETENYSYSENPLIWKSSIFHLHNNLSIFVERFIECEDELALCQIVGHSYELDIYKLWDEMENIFSLLSTKSDIWFATNIEIVDYLEAMKCITILSNKIINSSQRDLWFEVDGKLRLVKASSELVIK